MTGYPVRVCRNRVWQTVELDQLSDAEFDAFAEQCRQDRSTDGWQLAKFLARWIREYVKEPA
jgi:hypothetical protein